TCCEIVAVRDGFDVICRLPGIRPDLLLMSSELPRLNGLQICALLRQCPDYRELPVVLMVNDATAVKQARAELAGVSECLQKPFRRSELEAALMRLVNSDSVLTAVAGKRSFFLMTAGAMRSSWLTICVRLMTSAVLGWMSWVTSVARHGSAAPGWFWLSWCSPRSMVLSWLQHCPDSHDSRWFCSVVVNSRQIRPGRVRVVSTLFSTAGMGCMPCCNTSAVCSTASRLHNSPRH